MIRALIIADDLTGAMDTAVHFAGRGFSTQVLTRLPEKEGSRKAEKEPVFTEDGWLLSDTEVVAVNANSRHLSADQAYRIVYDLAKKAWKAGISCIYKKTDSALRGNVGAELSALRRALGMEMLPFIPAYPRLGRTVVDGVLLINGIPAAQTALGRDPIDPLASSEVDGILKNTAPAGETEQIRVFDAASGEDLVRTAEMLGDRVFVCAGCGGFAEVLAEKLSERCGNTIRIVPENAEDLQLPQGGMLLVCGSLHENSLLQVEDAGRYGYPVRMIPENILFGKAGNDCGCIMKAANVSEDGDTPGYEFEDTAGSEFIKEIEEILKSEKICILTTTDLKKPSDDIDIQNRELVQAGVGRIVLKICEAGCVNSLCIFGGDTLLAVMRKLGIDLMRIRREVQPGVVLGSIEYRERTIPVLTKAGSFGAPDLIRNLPGLQDSADLSAR